MVTRQLRGGSVDGGSGSRSRSPGTPARRGRRPRLAHPFGLRPMWQGSTRKWDLGEKRTSWANQLCKQADFGVRRTALVNTSSKGRVPAKTRPPMQDGATCGGLYAGGWKSWSFSLSVSVSVLVLGGRPGLRPEPGRLTPKMGAGDHPGEDAQPAPQRLPLLGGVRRRPVVS